MWLQIVFRGRVRAFVNEIVNKDKSHVSAVLSCRGAARRCAFRVRIRCAAPYGIMIDAMTINVARPATIMLAWL